MSEIDPLKPELLRPRCDPSRFSFTTTDEIDGIEEIFGQERALDAIEFGIGIQQKGFNLFLMGPAGLGKKTLVRRLLERRARSEPTPHEWCYVHNFAQPHKPLALRFPCGTGRRFERDMEQLIDDLQAAIPAALEIEEHRSRVQEIEEAAKERHDAAFEQLDKKAQSEGLRLIRTPAGFAIAPVREGEVIDSKEFDNLSEEEKKRITTAISKLQQDLRKIMEEIPELQKEIRDQLRELNREAARFVIERNIAKLREAYSGLPRVLKYLQEIERDAVEHAGEFGETEAVPMFPGMPQAPSRSFRRYMVNLIVDNFGCSGAPVVYEDRPTFSNLFGRAEHEARMGTLATDFTLIKPGSMHRANGGYLVVDAVRLLREPHAWEGLKRALMSENIRIESLGEALGLISTVSIEPEPIPLNVRVVLIGDRELYYLLHEFDHDFSELFKVAADFEDDMDRDEENTLRYVRLMASLTRQANHRPLDAAAVALAVEHAARLADDSEKLSTHMRPVADLLQEADYWARKQGAEIVSREHIQTAIDKQIHRADRIRARLQERIRRGTVLIDTEGAVVGQVNGLSVLILGNFSFGQPSRITATSRLGKGEVIDIEREAKLGGAIHSKGVLILSSFLAARFAKDRPLSLAASLVFEQSYGGVDGDSASVAELCALLSALSEVPIRQSLAVTGSVNQHGYVQPIGGANQKIEGFFDVCNNRGLTGEQGVIIPASNIKHLMLRQDICDAAEAGRFRVYAVSTVDEAISLLTGMPAGERDESGNYPAGTVNQRVEARLQELSDLRKEYSRDEKADKKE